MKCEKKATELNWQTSSVMRWLEGEEVIAYLDWDDRYYYVWFEPTWMFEDFCKENNREDMLISLESELNQIGVNKFYDLDDVNSMCKKYCGDDEPAQFNWNEFYECPIGE